LRAGKEAPVLSSDLVRSGAIGFVLGGTAWVVSGLLVVFGHPIMGPHPVYFLAFVAALLLTSAGLMGLHALQEGSYGRVGRAGLYTILFAFATQALGTAVLLSRSSAFVLLVFQVGLLAKLAGFVLYGAATLQAGVLPRWYGLTLIVLVPVSVGLLLYGNIWTGLVLMILGYALWLRRGKSVA
jgi:hypothetical protein